MEKLTFMTPIRMTSMDQFKKFEHVLKSYYDCISYENVRHLIKDDSPQEFREKVKNLVLSFNPKADFHYSPKTTMSQAFEYLISKVETKYCSFLLDDVYPVVKKDIFDLCIKAMDLDDLLMQVCVGGTFLVTDKSNLSNIYLNNDDIYIYKKVKVEKILLNNNNVVWKTKNNVVEISNFMYIMAIWNQVLRSEPIKKYYKTIRDIYNPPPETSADPYLTYGYKNRRWSNALGWADGLEWLSDYNIGYLNFCAYLYPMDRLYKDGEKYIQDHCNEVREDTYREMVQKFN